MILAVAGSRATLIGDGWSFLLRLYLARTTLLVHGGQPDPDDPQLRSVDAWSTDLAAMMMPSVPVLIPPTHRPRGRIAAWCATQRRVGAEVVLLAFPGGAGTQGSVHAFRERGLPVVVM